MFSNKIICIKTKDIRCVVFDIPNCTAQQKTRKDKSHREIETAQDIEIMRRAVVKKKNISPV